MHAPRCGSQRTITVPVEVSAKPRQKHDYPSAAHRRSYARRSAVERANSTVKDPATTDVALGWCWLMGLAPIGLILAYAFIASPAGRPGPSRRPGRTSTPRWSGAPGIARPRAG